MDVLEDERRKIQMKDRCYWLNKTNNLNNGKPDTRK